MASITQDLRYSLRVLRKAPGFTAVAALTLGLGIGANAAMIGLFDALLVRPPAGVTDPERVVGFRAERPALRGNAPEMTAALSYPQFAALREGARGFSGVAAFSSAPIAVGEGESVRNEPVLLASGEYFRVLGARPALGRLFQPDDDREGTANPVAVLSWDYWRRAYGGDPGVLGEPITVGGRQLTVVGVTPKHFVGSELASPSLWVPLSLAPQLGFEPEMITSPFVSWLSVIGRLAPGVTEEQARATAQAAFLAAREAAATAPAPGRRGGRTPGSARVEMRAGPGSAGGEGRAREAPPPPRAQLARIGGIGRAAEGPGGGSPVQTWHLAVTAAVLLIACANVANLLLARGAYRSHELAVRLSMGATPGRLARQLLTESAVLAALGGLAGFVVALGVWRLLPAVIEMPPLPTLLDLRALAIVAFLTLLTVVLFGMVPVAGLRRPDIRTVLGSAAPSIARRSRGRSALVVAQFAVCVVLLIGAGLFVRSFQEVRALDLGYDRDRVLVVTADTRGAGWTPERVEAYWAAARERIESLPGVEGVEAGATVPYLMRIAMPLTAAPADAAEGVSEEPVQIDFVGPSYFETLGISILEGRAFTGDDREGSAPVAIVSRSFARRRFAAPSPIGRCLVAPMGGCIEVVGVAEDARFGELTDESPEFVYRPLEQMSTMMPPPAVLHVRAAGDPQGLIAALRAEMRAVDSSAPPAEVRPLAELTAPQLAPWRASAVLLAVFGGIGLLLAAVGLYGVIAFLVARRTREIGIRVALGAARGSIVRLVVGDAARLVGAGAVLGLLLAAWASRVIGSMLYGVSLLDPAVYLATAGLLVAVSLLAALSPARRALRVDPMEALRSE